MENVPVNESSPKNTTPATSPQRTLAENDQPPVETNTGDDTVLKTPEEVLAELTDDDDDLIPNGGDEGNEEDDGAFRTMVIALTADGSSVIQQVGSDGHVFKKRKGNQLKDPPSGSPTCPECKRKFATWKAAFGHMRKHPERAHRGFFPPPTFSTVAPVPAEGAGLGDKINEGVNSLARELVFDLNRSIESTAGSSAGGSGHITKEIQAAPTPAPEPAPAPAENEERRIRDFDLNELPPPEEDEETEEK